MKPLLAHKDHLLVSHLEEVAKLSAEFTASFDATEQGRLAGFLHDLGKAEAEFQERIVSEDKDEGKKKPHAHHGAAYALRACFPAQWPVALSVNGHHAGLHNRGNVDQKAEEYKDKAKRCLQTIQEAHPGVNVPSIQEMLPEWLKRLEFLPGNKGAGWLATDLFTRFLFSALVDADRLDSSHRFKSFSNGSLLNGVDEPVECSSQGPRAIAQWLRRGIVASTIRPSSAIPSSSVGLYWNYR